MTSVIIKKKNRLLTKKKIVADPYSTITPEIFKNINSQIIKERKKLVPDKKKRMAVIRLAKSKSLSQVGWVTCDPRVAMVKFVITAWVQEPTLL